MFYQQGKSEMETSCSVCGKKLSGGLDTFGVVGKPLCWDDFIVPELGRIDMLVETPTEKIAYECDGFFHYGVSRLNKNKNFAKQFNP